jgi:hypothetical protein
MEQPQDEGRKKVNRIAAILVAALLVASTLVVISTSGFGKTVTRTSTSTSTSTVTVVATGDASLLSDCSGAPINASDSFTLVAGTSSAAIVCLQFYEFDPNSSITLNATNLLFIDGSKPDPGSCLGCIEEVLMGGNFTVVASQEQVIVGGPSNANEGTVVAYAITSRPGASGTYALGVEGNEPGGLSCTDYGELIAGSGEPNYAIMGTCVVFGSDGPTHTFTIPGISYPLLGNTLYFRFITLANSTQ